MDQKSDTNRSRLYQISKIVELPSYVKSASAETLKVAALPPRAYADPTSRKFPCDSAASTWLSNAYYKYANLRGELDNPEIESALTNMANFWGISKDTKAASDTLSAHFAEKPYADSDYAIVNESGRHYRMASSAEVKAAAGWLEKNYEQLSLEDMTKVARKLIEKAAALKVEIQTQHLKKLAAIGDVDKEKLAAVITRCTHGVNHQTVQRYFKAAKDTFNKPTKREDRLQFAEIIEKAAAIYNLGIKRSHILSALFGV